MAQIIAIAGRKGGAGKTTTALDLAGVLAARDARTVSAMRAALAPSEPSSRTS